MPLTYRHWKGGQQQQQDCNSHLLWTNGYLLITILCKTAISFLLHELHTMMTPFVPLTVLCDCFYYQYSIMLLILVLHNQSTDVRFQCVLRSCQPNSAWGRAGSLSVLWWRQFRRLTPTCSTSTGVRCFAVRAVPVRCVSWHWLEQLPWPEWWAAERRSTQALLPAKGWQHK